jgi:hypothetical protein
MESYAPTFFQDLEKELETENSLIHLNDFVSSFRVFKQYVDKFEQEESLANANNALELPGEYRLVLQISTA